MVSTPTTNTNDMTTSIKPKVSITTASKNGDGAVTTSHGHMTNDPNIYSYQNSSNSSNPYETPPTIHQYHSDDDPLQRSVGDTSIRPNIGLTNRYAEHALFGLAYHELMTRLQISVTINALMVLVLLFLTWYLQIFQPIHLALSVVLAVLSFILVMVEGRTVLNNVFSSASPLSSSNASDTSSTTTSNNANTTIHVVLKQLEQIGTIILYHPIGKTSYLLISSLLCFYITGVMMFLFSIWFLGNAIALIYCYVTYPECRKSFQEQHERSSSTTTDDTDNNNVTRSWSSYYSDIANTTTVTSWVSERASLLRT